MFNNRAQGSLEYLIIVAAVLAIGAIVIMFIVSTTNAQNVKNLVGKCQSSATSCAMVIMSSGQANCASTGICDSCNVSKVPQLSGKIVTTTGVTPQAACNAGNASMIILNSS